MVVFLCKGEQCSNGHYIMFMVKVAPAFVRIWKGTLPLLLVFLLYSILKDHNRVRRYYHLKKKCQNYYY